MLGRRRTSPLKLLVLSAAALLLALSSVAAAPVEQFVGRVVRVLDGDTIAVMRDGREVRLRLDGIDCPEKGQDFGQRAKSLTSDLVSGQDVRVVVKDHDHYGRLVSRVLVGNRDVSVALVEAGLAWHYTQYSNDRVLAAAERQAMASRLGLWSLPNPTPPWTFRHPTNQASAPARALPASPKSRVTVAGNGVLHGNAQSRVLHAASCRSYGCKNCTVTFASREEGERAGYRSHVGPGGCMGQ